MFNLYLIKMKLGIINRNNTFFAICTIFLIFYMMRSWDSAQNTPINLKNVLTVAIKSAENGGIEVIRVKDKFSVKSKGLTKEGMQDDVTIADYLSHCSMVSTISYFFKNINLISEESTDCYDQFIDYTVNNNVDIKKLPNEYVNQEDVTVWIDPLDATHEYTERLFEYVTTMVCVAVKGKPIIGVIHKPFLKQTYWAWVGKEKSKNIIIKKASRNQKQIIISRSHSGKIQEVITKSFFHPFNLVKAAGAGYKALEVAVGNVDAYLHVTNIKKWDICAGNAILNAVNGRMTTKFNQDIDYSHSTNKLNEDGLVATLEDHSSYVDIFK